MKLINFGLYSGHYKVNKLIKYFLFEAIYGEWIKSLVKDKTKYCLLNDFDILMDKEI